MKFTLDWLSDHIQINSNVSTTELADRLTALGVEVEKILDNSEKYNKFFIGQIIKADKHPNADKLSLCEVDIGSQLLSIVCGAPNVREKMMVIVSVPGAIIPITGEPLKKGKIRGIDSEGMMCSAEEMMFLDRFPSNGGIIELEGDYVPGTSLSKALDLNDVVFDVSITPNRGDCLSVRGIARLLSASGIGTLKEFKIEDTWQEDDSCYVDVSIDTDDCLYFSDRVIKNITPATETPEFIKKRLEAIGQKSIHPAVDIANYICFDIGQPMHMFDLDKIDSDKIVLKNAGPNETLDTLNGIKGTKIPEDSIVIYSNNTPISIAGIMGGSPTGCTDETTNVLIESAYFNKIAISLAGQKLRINSDARTRNERGTDPAIVDLAMNYATSLMKRVYPECKVFKVKKHGQLSENRNKITVSYKKFTNLSGLSRDVWEKSKEFLEKLDIQMLELDDEKMTVLTPSCRHDLSIEEDIIEEILILNGYDNVPFIDIPKDGEPINCDYMDEKLSDVLVYNGYNEIKTFSFIDDSTESLFSSNDVIKIRDPLTNEFTVLRTSVVASILKCLKNNQNRSQENCKFFEIGKKFSIVNGKISENNMLTLVISGMENERSWLEKQAPVSVFDIKRVLEKILDAAGVRGKRIKQSAAPSYYHPGRNGAYIFNKNETIAYFGEVHPVILKEMDINMRVVCAEIFLDSLPLYVINKMPKQITLSPFQPISRDFSFVVSDGIEAQKIVDAIKTTKIEELQRISVFDVYKLDNDKKAIGVEVILQSSSSPLVDERINEITNGIIDSVKNNCDGTIRM